MSELPPVTPQLARFVAMRLADVTAQDWSELSEETRREHIVRARKLLMAERRFIARKQDAETATPEASAS